MVKKKEIQNSIFEIVRLLTNNFVNKEGLISSTYPPSKNSLISHFDDIFPFLLHLEVERSFLRSQIIRSRSHTYSGLFKENNKVVSYENDEYLGALFEYYRKYREKKIYRLIKESLYGIDNLLIKENFLWSYYYIPDRKTPLVSSPRNGALLETLIENRDLITSNLVSRFDRIIKKTLKTWIKCEFFQKYNLFPSKLFFNRFKNKFFCYVDIPLPKRIRHRAGSAFYYSKGWKAPFINFLYQLPIGEKVQCMKENTNFVFSLIEACKVYGEKMYKNAIGKWIEGIKKNMYNEGFIYKFWTPPNKFKEIELAQNFAVIDILCDTYKFVSNNKNHLDLAENIANSWINERWDIGLIPRNPKGDCNHLDEQTDFSISLMRLYELTKKEKYKKIAISILEGVLKFHRTEHGYIMSVDNKGRAVDSTISPKYNSLFLKLLILFYEERNIYKCKYLYSLLKDR